MATALDTAVEMLGGIELSHAKRLIETLKGAGIADLAIIVLEIAQVKPYKKRRLKMLARERKDLLKKLEETGLIFAHHW